MKIIPILLPLALCLAFFACKTPQYNASNLPDTQLRFGYGGGVVGKETTYCLLENGQIFVSKYEREMEEVPNAAIKPKDAEVFYERATALGLTQKSIMEPGNTYQFIESQKGDVVMRTAWDGTQSSIDKEIQQFYNDLSDLVKN